MTHRKKLLARIMLCSAMAMTAVTIAPSSADAATPADSQVEARASSYCVALGFLVTCTTNAIHADPSCHCIHAALSGATGWGNVHDINSGAHVGPSNFFGAVTI